MMGFWRGMVKPINPRLASMIGLLNIMYGLVLLLPEGETVYKNNREDLIVGLGLIVLGSATTIAVVNEMFKSISFFVGVDAIAWSVNTSFHFVTDIYNPMWTAAFIISLYSVVVSANIWVNYVYTNYDIMEKR